MTTEELAQKFDHPRREGKVWRARCPVHKSRGLTLAIYADAERSSVYCHAGCSSDDVLKAVGLTWKDTFYAPRTRMSARELAEMQRKRDAEERKASNLRIGTWIVRFTANGYTADDYEQDLSIVCGASMLLAHSDHILKSSGFNKLTWEKILGIHVERIAAANYCRAHRMLPEVAKEITWSI